MVKLIPHLDDQLHSFVNFKTFEVVYVYHLLPVYPEKYLGIQLLLKVVKALISQILLPDLSKHELSCSLYKRTLCLGTKELFEVFNSSLKVLFFD
jgi:hypothetical protein